MVSTEAMQIPYVEDIVVISLALANVEVAHCIRLDWVDHMH